MRLKDYLHQISPVLSSHNAVRRLLRIFALVLLVGILGGVYSFLLFTFNNEISQRRSYMSSAIAEAHTFFTTREALLGSLSLSATRKVEANDSVSDEEIRLLLGQTPGKQWNIWLTQRMRDFLKAKQLNLLYVGTEGQVLRLYNAISVSRKFPQAMLDQLDALKRSKTLQELWLTHAWDGHSQLYIFIRLDERDVNSGWLGLEMDDREVSSALNDHSAGEFTMFNAQGMALFSNSQKPPPGQNLPLLRQQDFFGFVGAGWLPEQLVLRKQLKSSDWQLTYSIDLRAVLWALWPQLLGALAFCLLSISLVCVLIRRLEHRFITPALHRIQALVESELFSRDVIQTAPVALCVLRRSDGQVVLENTLARQWLGQCGEQLGPGWIRDAFDASTPHLTDYFETADGRHLYLSCAPTRYKGEDVLLCAFSDISARTQIEAALEQARQSADAANEAKTLFLATMSHEIRTPLYGVLGTLELLARTRLDSQQKSYLRAIEGSSATLLQLICDVLDVSKIEAGQLALELSEFCVPALVQEVVQGYAAAAQSKGLQLYACLDPQLPERLKGDVSRVRQILNNLLSNAVKFTDSGRVVLRVKLLSREGERVCLQWQVSDTGKGIAHEDQAYIFEPFYQTQGNTNVVAGTGLGLPICLRLTHLMNGTLRMVSEPGLGSSFSLTVPLEQLREQVSAATPTALAAEIVYVVSPVRELAESFSGWLRRWGARPHIGVPVGMAPGVLLELHPGACESVLPWEGPRVTASGEAAHEPQSTITGWKVNLNDLNAIEQALRQAQGGQLIPPQEPAELHTLRPLGLHILVAEDNVINQLILRDQLEELGCSVTLTRDGEEALSHWHDGGFDLVLTDVNMPKLNGYELAKALRGLGCTTPIIGATANALRGEDALCLAAGMNHCLIKPFTLRALFTALAPYERAAHEAL
ncbi:hybrid sensor histidine kinase/response regulator [Pseudomonas fluorescens]|jgi:two-component system capsular synthesis sensor histidine kinase RcsC|uniref:ATP-binding protein n=3 Tax=Pseudomonas TaxID=286 RepID=UPI0010C1D111|nr:MULTISPECIES: ATP-binding protein [unclassified Pseudomonas]MCF5516357.1 response regulator [Pseudomonas sp. PA-3-6E]MCF5563545.1 response regulator [Pseudomonas sp. PA-3-5D]MCF5568939.1 response regulator [Pseudomonas sp. PA-3-11C]TKK39009.1 hybrid sensor histidine kinase/response regulator [Pseudomonas fluorescens]